jgi:AcrR family transcriptional regulator
VSLRERNRARTAEEIERVALALFETRGYAPTTVTDIAGAAGVSVRTFFRYFPAKEDVVFADHKRHLQALRECVFEAAQQGNEAAVLRSAVGRFARYLQKNHEAVARARLATTDESLSLRARAMRADWEDALAESLAEAKGLRKPGLDERLLAGAVTSALAIALDIWLTGGRDDLDRLVDKALVRVAALHRG